MVLKRTAGFNLRFQSVCSDRLLEKAEHTDRNVELKPAVLFRTAPTHLEMVIMYMVFMKNFPNQIYIDTSSCNASNRVYILRIPNLISVGELF